MMKNRGLKKFSFRQRRAQGPFKNDLTRIESKIFEKFIPTFQLIYQTTDLALLLLE